MPWLEPFASLVDPAGGHIAPAAVAIEDPTAGRIEGGAAVVAFLADRAAWLQARQAVTRQVATTIGGGRRVAEFEVDLTVDERRLTLPVAVMIEPQASGRPTEIRIYHSQWPLLGRHRVRPPLLAADPSVRESDVVGIYQRALASGDAATITATFEPDGCFREPAGPF